MTCCACAAGTAAAAPIANVHTTAEESVLDIGSILDEVRADLVVCEGTFYDFNNSGAGNLQVERLHGSFVQRERRGLLRRARQPFRIGPLPLGDVLDRDRQVRARWQARDLELSLLIG